MTSTTITAEDFLPTATTVEEPVRKARWMDTINDMHSNYTGPFGSAPNSYRRPPAPMTTGGQAASASQQPQPQPQPPYRPVSPFFSSSAKRQTDAGSPSMSATSASPWTRSVAAGGGAGGPTGTSSGMELSAWERRERSMDAVLGNTIRCLERTVSGLSFSTSTPPPAPIASWSRRSSSGHGLLYSSGRWPQRHQSVGDGAAGASAAKDKVVGVEDHDDNVEDGREPSTSLLRNASEGTHVPHSPKSCSQHKTMSSRSRSRREVLVMQGETDTDNNGNHGMPSTSARRPSRRGARGSKRRDSALSSGGFVNENDDNTEKIRESPVVCAAPDVSPAPHRPATTSFHAIQEEDGMIKSKSSPMDRWRCWWVAHVPPPVRLLIAVLLIAVFHFLATFASWKLFP